MADDGNIEGLVELDIDNIKVIVTYCVEKTF